MTNRQKKMKKYVINLMATVLIVFVTSCNEKDDGKVSVTEVTIDLTTITMTPNGIRQLTATVLPDNATNKKVIWQSNNSKVATVNDDGLVTAVAAGKATITAIAEGGNKKAQCEVSVEEGVAVTGVRLNYYGNRLMEPNEEVVLTFGPTLYLFAVVSPENATNQKVTWENSDETVATFTVYGNGDRIGIKALAAGKTTITVITEDGKKTVSCIVYVPPGGGLESANINMRVSYGTISDRSITSGQVLNVRQGTSLNFKIHVTFGSFKHFLQFFRIISWNMTESAENMVMEEKLYEDLHDGINEHEFEYTTTVIDEEVLFFELSNYSREVFVIAQITVKPY